MAARTDGGPSSTMRAKPAVTRSISNAAMRVPFNQVSSRGPRIRIRPIVAAVSKSAAVSGGPLPGGILNARG